MATAKQFRPETAALVLIDHQVGTLQLVKSARPVLGNPASGNRAVPLMFDQFRFAFANAVGEDKVKEIYESFAVSAPGMPLFQATTANLNSWTEDKVNTENPERGPLPIVSARRGRARSWSSVLTRA